MGSRCANCPAQAVAFDIRRSQSDTAGGVFCGRQRSSLALTNHWRIVHCSDRYVNSDGVSLCTVSDGNYEAVGAIEVRIRCIGHRRAVASTSDSRSTLSRSRADAPGQSVTVRVSCVQSDTTTGIFCGGQSRCLTFGDHGRVIGRIHNNGERLGVSFSAIRHFNSHIRAGNPVLWRPIDHTCRTDGHTRRRGGQAIGQCIAINIICNHCVAVEQVFSCRGRCC